MTAGEYQEKTTAQIEADKKAEYERGKKEAAEEARKNMLAAQSGRTVPVDGKGGAAPRGALMRRALARQPKDKDGEVDTTKIPLGKGIARAAAQEYYDKQAAQVGQ
jgi:ribosomal protein L9